MTNVDVSRKVWANSEWCSFGGICWTSSCKHAPWNSAKQLTNKHDFDAGGKEDDEDEASECGQRHHQDFAMSPLGSSPAVEHSTDNVGNGSDGVELLLPRSRDLVARFFVKVFSILVAEAGISKERADLLFWL